jgi:hypothetical protein
MRFVEFFEGEHRLLSMTRLVLFMSFFPASYVIVKYPSSETLSWYLSAYVLGYVGGKGADVLTQRKKDDTIDMDV